MKGLFFLLAFCFTPLCYGVPAAAPSPNAGDLTALAARAETQKDYRAACRFYLSALAADPGNQGLWNSLRRAADKMEKSLIAERREEASRYVRDAERRVERDYAGQQELRDRAEKGRKLVSQGNLLEASDVFNRLLEESPGFDEARFGIQRTQRALAAQLKRGKFSSPSQLAATQGVHFYNQQLWPQAGQNLRVALSAGLPAETTAGRLDYYAAKAEENHKKQLWSVRRGELMAKAQQDERDGKIKEARLSLQEILKGDPADREALAALEELGIVTKTVSRAMREEAKQKEVPRLLVKGTMLAAQQQYTDALATFNEVLIIDPTNREAAEQISEVKRLMKGQGLFVPQVSAKSQADALYSEGLNHYGNERYDQAKSAFKEALRQDPKHEGARQALERLK